MKTTVHWLINILFVIIPMMATAQTNIQAAFDAIIKCPEAQIVESHNLDKDPITNTKSGQCDIYSFVLPVSKFNLIKNVISAFDADSHLAYSFNSGKTTPTEPKMLVAVGDGQTSVRINRPDCEYIDALFLAPQSEDPEGKFRYVYAMNYKKEGNTFEGQLIITYALTLSYRQKTEQERQQLDQLKQLRVLHSLSQSSDGFSQSWFDTMISCLQGMESVGARTQVALATKAYNLVKDIKEFPEVTKQDKVAITEIIKEMLSNKEYNSNTILVKILNQCLIGLK
ncbi:MAG: hypothetical protein K2K26_02490 [Muribaculaceae bacterium]|nr:hypothetical protein [Muribaculaceae bacterium]